MTFNMVLRKGSSVPTENDETSLQKKLKKKVVYDKVATVILLSYN